MPFFRRRRRRPSMLEKPAHVTGNVYLTGAAARFKIGVAPSSLI
jgi:hypothetical protein